MQVWTVEKGTLWSLALGNSLPPRCPARVKVKFEEATMAAAGDLAVAMALSAPGPVQERLQTNRRCFVLRADGQIVSYAWITQGTEYVGELDRHFYFHDDEAYIWDCGTTPAWRGQRCYSALLSHLLYQLDSEGVVRAWIGASRLNRPSVAGFANAGFKAVVDVTYIRLARLTILWIDPNPSAASQTLAAAYRIMRSPSERRMGPLTLGYLTGGRA